MMKHNKLVLGVRDFSQPDVPPRSRMGNRITCGVFKIFVGMNISDTQTGLRAIPTEDVKTLITIYGDRFEYETNMLLAMKDYGIAFDEVKIRTVYIEENKSSHFHAIKDSWRIYKLILKHFFRYTISSIVSAVVDNGMFALLSGLLHTILAGFPLTAVCSVSARVVSSLLNFFMNHKLVFQSRVSTGKAMLRYYMLAIPQMAAQVLLTQGVYWLFAIPDSATGLRTLLYAVVMTVLYIASYMIQQRWVFAAKTSTK
jgi:putative flippase GtrA